MSHARRAAESPRRRAVWLLLAVACAGGCGKSNAPPRTTASAPRAIVPAAETIAAEKSEEATPTADAPTVTTSTLASSSSHPSQPAEPAVEPADAPRERLVLFTPRGPLIMHFQIFIQGQPQRAAAEGVLQQAVEALGTAGASGPSWATLVANARFASGDFGNVPLQSAAEGRQVTQRFDVNRDGRVQRKELAALLAQDDGAGSAFAVQSVSEFGGGYKQDSPLFALLDQDEDGQLSAAEMSHATTRLRSRDGDDDDVVVLADYRGSPGAEDAMGGRRRYERRPAVELTKLEIDSIYYALCELYEAGSKLDSTTFALTPGLLAWLDTDQSGAVDQKELAAMLEARADVLLKVHFGSPSAKRAGPALESIELSDDLTSAGAQVRPDPGRVTISLPDLELEMLVQDAMAEPDPLPAALAQFAKLDSDKNDLLEGEELVGLGLVPGLDLQDLDESGDGNLSLDEIKKAFAKPRRYRAAQVHVRVGQVEDALFSWLDTNRDGRLSSRELLGAAARLAQLDHDGDGRVTAAEIPDGLTCAIVRGPRSRDAMALEAYIPPANLHSPPPRWLAAMDQNGDGEVSRREFLGTPDEFARLDANADGFLDADEVPHEPAAAP